jgi:hypothetical protein
MVARRAACSGSLLNKGGRFPELPFASAYDPKQTLLPILFQ